MTRPHRFVVRHSMNDPCMSGLIYLPNKYIEATVVGRQCIP
jgi:hypothetical protein